MTTFAYQVLDHLRNQGCHQAQGFYICKPLSGDELAVWYRQYLQSHHKN
jgi:EAL domain-containing protein (putative c-di-GMP-specific phosphodiesterase class I)